MEVALGIILGFAVLTFLISAHEFGHFLMARRSGVRVKEFGIGFPPRAAAWVRSKPEHGKKKGKWHKISRKDWKKEQSSLVFSLNYLPIGGFCAMDGESDDETRPGTFGSVNFWKKTKILFGGVMMNWLVAFFILTILCWVGLPEILDNQFSIKSDESISTDSHVTVGTVKENSPAEKAGFLAADQLISAEAHKYTAEQCAAMGITADGHNPCDDIDTIIINSPSDVTDFNEAHAGNIVTYTVERRYLQECAMDCTSRFSDDLDKLDDCINECQPYAEDDPTHIFTLTATLNETGSEYLLGVTMSRPTIIRQYTWSAPVVAAGLTAQTTLETFKGLGKLVVDLVTGAARQVSSDESVRQEGKEQLEDASNSVSGIVGIVGNYFPNLLSAGLTYILLFTAVISISLACMNVLPIPALDGGRWFMIFIARLRHKKLSKEREQAIISKAVVFLLILMAIITVLDIIKLF
ncbi:site-2 protease family protein [Candidatus Saccharibacteria bacterium]|nr:site-2 protease family protein [Candidatus Saccharibacteria bacterium]